ncbi:hypothetical protein H2201_009120 [Coniosporium apollinis]|uniref:Integral membrane protein n=1 Tax=Coniosporium apollinis TaxID=61459 RepID=A0ABQ9NF71_9PEZI|nr:hypothetical protein H2201_009120 [Coniosporium apollinis]
MSKFAHYAYVAAPILLSLASTVCIVVVSFASYRPHPGSIDGFEFAVIDASKVKAIVYDDTYYGLPDSYDYSKHKDFYFIYLWNYCSGTLHGGRRVTDFCSKPRHLLFDLFGFWKSWGISVQKGGVNFYWLEQGPWMLYVAYVVAWALKVVELLACVATARRWGLRVTAMLSVLATLAILTTSIIAQVTFGTLVSRADDDDIDITAESGKIIYILNWLATSFSSAATVLWCYRVWTRRPGPKRQRTLVEKTPYTYEQMSHSNIDLRGRDTAKLLPNAVVGEERKEHNNGRYEPFRRPPAMQVEELEELEELEKME